VNYEICFADGTRCWLDDIEERPVTDPQEMEDFKRFEQEKFEELERQNAEKLRQMPIKRGEVCAMLGNISDRRLRQFCQKKGRKLPTTRAEANELKTLHDQSRDTATAKRRRNVKKLHPQFESKRKPVKTGISAKPSQGTLDYQKQKEKLGINVPEETERE